MEQIEVTALSDEEKEKHEQIKTINITELVEDNPIFESQGSTTIKVTKKGVEQHLAIPIESSGITDLMDEFNRKAPTPPVIRKLVHPNDPVGKELRLAKKQFVQMYDYTDETYVTNKAKHDSDLGLKVVLLGLSIPIKDKEGNVIEDPDKKLKALKGMGLTGSQFQKVFDDIQALTAFTEEVENDFLD